MMSYTDMVSSEVVSFEQRKSQFDYNTMQCYAEACERLPI